MGVEPPATRGVVEVWGRRGGSLATMPIAQLINSNRRRVLACVCCSRLRSSMATGEEFMVLADDPVLPRFSTRAAAFGCCCCLFTPPAGRDNCCTWTCPVAMPCRIIRRAPAAGRPRGEQLGVANQAIARGCFETRGDSAALPHETWTIWGSLFEGCNLWKNASICL